MNSVIGHCNASSSAGCSTEGVSGTHWFIAIVKYNTEFATQEKLKAKGVETYTPFQNKVVETTAGRKRNRKRVVIPTILFIHCSEDQRKEIIKYPFINHFMVNRTGAKDSFGRYPIARIPEEQIAKLKFMVGNSDDDVVMEPLGVKFGDEVKVIRGGLKGLVGNVERINNETRLLIRIDALGYAAVRINASDLKKI